jgi:hypothetical protein
MLFFLGGARGRSPLQIAATGRMACHPTVFGSGVPALSKTLNPICATGNALWAQIITFKCNTGWFSSLQ